MSRALLADYKIIVIENLSQKVRSQEKTIDFLIFIKVLEEEAKKVESILLTIDPRYTSQSCSQCGEIDIDYYRRDKREFFYCSYCDNKGRLHKDHNAAINIRKRGIKELAKAGFLILEDKKEVPLYKRLTSYFDRRYKIKD